MKMNQKQQHTDQFMEHYERYHDDIFRFVMVKTRDRALSLDITQETFMKFWEYIIKDKEIEQERPRLVAQFQVASTHFPFSVVLSSKAVSVKATQNKHR